MMLSSPKQRQMIGFLRKTLQYDDDTYRDILGFYGVSSSTGLSYSKANDLIDFLRNKAIGLGLYQAKPNNYNKYQYLGYRRDWATPKQLKKVEIMWKKVSIKETDEEKEKALNSFIFRITGKKRVNFLTHFDIQKLIKALEQIEKRGNYATNC